MNDHDIRQHVIDELEFDPRVNAAHIGVAVSNNIVTLTGHVASYLEKLAAEQATRRVKGVYGIAQEIEVRLPSEKKLADDEIAARAAQIVSFDSALPQGVIQATVHQGWVTLTGKVGRYFEKTAAEHAVRKLTGITGVSNKIEVVPAVILTDVKERIDAALKRNAEIETQNIKLQVEDGKVTVKGKVASWHERDIVLSAARSVPSVREIDDQLTLN
ncbi:MAG TPA: BON domain-containing protein [Acidocella sp.]|jgi:osmotically-inducible protein OsmY|uniref:BON domain-containing protein n=1 Tax=Acidocella sp. TaxID=50710 RepID=UPI002C5A1685|nr:BON domain-containing protein [Acidocella sp.]HVE22868.1 BON domain-containing protein [Acidocella sp.]